MTSSEKSFLIPCFITRMCSRSSRKTRKSLSNKKPRKSNLRKQSNQETSKLTNPNPKTTEYPLSSKNSRVLPRFSQKIEKTTINLCSKSSSSREPRPLVCKRPNRLATRASNSIWPRYTDRIGSRKVSWSFKNTRTGFSTRVMRA